MAKGRFFAGEGTLEWRNKIQIGKSSKMWVNIMGISPLCKFSKQHLRILQYSRILHENGESKGMQRELSLLVHMNW